MKLKLMVADRLRLIIAPLAPGTPVFAMPEKVAKMLAADLAVARHAWIEATDDPAERDRRSRSDFLQRKNFAGEILDFHALRHTCGAWAAQSGASPNSLKMLMRHSTITLTLDVYGHLFPKEEVATAARVSQMLEVIDPEVEREMAQVAERAQRQAQRAGSETVPEPAKGCETLALGQASADEPKSIRRTELSETLQRPTKVHETGPGRTRTGNPRIMSPLL